MTLTLPYSELPGNLRRLRASRGLTLVQLAEITDVSRATLSRIERGETEPSALVLGRLAAALETSLSRLLGHQQARRPLLLSAFEQPIFRDPASGLERRSISPSFPDRSVDLALNTLPPGRAVEFPPHQHGVEEYLHVLSGALSVSVAGESFTVTAGATLFYPADVAHGFRNEGMVEAVFAIMIDSQHAER